MPGKDSQNHLGFRLSYRGSDFFGFQRQARHPTIQSKLEEALEKIFRRKLRIHFVSRTDAGVNAFDHWVYLPGGMHLYRSLPQAKRQRLMASLNFLLGPSIKAWDALEIDYRFSPQRDVLWKQYEYRVWNGPFENPFETATSAWVRAPLCLEPMRQAAKHLIGLHDFSAFAKSSGRATREAKRGSRRHLKQIRIVAKAHRQISAGRLVSFELRADGFLRHMVRSIVGSLLDIGMGSRLDIAAILRSQSRTEAGRNMPGEALFLTKTKVRSRSFSSLVLPPKI